MPENPLPIEIDCVAAKARLDANECALLLDCRERDEWDLVKIEGAQLWPMSELPDQLAKLAPYRDRTIFVYCHHGVRSLHVAMWLRQQGFARTASIAGGIDRWTLEIDRTLPRY